MLVVRYSSEKDLKLSKFKTYALRGMWYVGTVRVVQGYGAGGTVVRCRGYGGTVPGVRWVRWRGAVGTVEWCGGYGGGVRWVRWVRWRGPVGVAEGYSGYGGGVRWAQWGSGHGGATVGAVEGGYTRMVEKYEDEGRKVQIAALTRGRYLSTSC